MWLYKKLRQVLENEKRILRENRAAVAASNRNLFMVLTLCGALIYALLFVVTFIAADYEELRVGYVGIFTVLTVAAALAYKINYPVYFYYVFYGLMAAHATYSGAFITPDYMGIIMVLLLFEIPILILDKTAKVTFYELLLVTIYLAVVVPNKDTRLVSDEIINTLTAMFIGSISGAFFRWERLKSMDLTRKLDFERTTDTLTGLPNRRMLFEYFGRQETDKDLPQPAAIAIMDIDNFKKYNDTYGHIMGDSCLRSIGACFNKFGQANGVKFYRYGGEEFIAVIMDKPASGVVEFLTELNKAVEDLKITHSALPGGYVTISVGVVCITDEMAALSFEQLVDNADKALYAAKSSGKNKTVDYKNL